MSSADLITELRAARPVAGEALRERVRALSAGAPAPRPSLAARLRPLRVLLAALPAASALALATAGAIGLARADGPGREAVGPAAAEDALRGTSTKESAQLTAPSAFGAAGSAGALPPATARPQRYAAELTLEVEDAAALGAATQRARQITDSLGGFVLSSSLDTTGENGASSLVVRVPTTRVQEAIVRLSALGSVVAQRISVEDLGGQIDALARQESALVAEIGRLERQLARTRLTPEERASLRGRLLQARAELGQVRAAQAQSREDARLATVSLLLRTEEGSGTAPVPSRLDRALDEAASILAWEGIALLYALVVAGPFALAAAGFWLARRMLRRREDERLLASSP